MMEKAKSKPRMPSGSGVHIKRKRTITPVNLAIQAKAVVEMARTMFEKNEESSFLVIVVDKERVVHSAFHISSKTEPAFFKALEKNEREILDAKRRGLDEASYASEDK